jgi:hypothetical protein
MVSLGGALTRVAVGRVGETRKRLWVWRTPRGSCGGLAMDIAGWGLARGHTQSKPMERPKSPLSRSAWKSRSCLISRASSKSGATERGDQFCRRGKELQDSGTRPNAMESGNCDRTVHLLSRLIACTRTRSPGQSRELPPPLASITPLCNHFTIPRRLLTLNRRFPRRTTPARRCRKLYPSWASEATALKVTRSIGAWVSFLHW